jgi:hypothetical protein
MHVLRRLQERHRGCQLLWCVCIGLKRAWLLLSKSSATAAPRAALLLVVEVVQLLVLVLAVEQRLLLAVQQLLLLLRLRWQAVSPDGAQPALVQCPKVFHFAGRST